MLALPQDAGGCEKRVVGMKPLMRRFGKLILKAGWGTIRLFLKHPAAVVTTVLTLIALGLGYRMWRVGFPAAISSLPFLLLCVILIIVTLLARGKTRQWTQTSVSRGKAAAQKRIVRGIAQEGIDVGEVVLEKGAETAKGAVTTLTEEVKADWERYVAKLAPGSTSPQASRCPHCGRFLRSGARFCDGCGKPLPLTCPRCGQTLRPAARFCDHCGTPLGSENAL